MKPDIEKAKQVLTASLEDAWDKSVTKGDMIVAAARALGFLTGYELPQAVLANYVCSHCDASGVKLWRAAHSAQEAWCSRCGTSQAGLEDAIDEQGKMESTIGCGRTDQIYSSKQGLNLLPWVPDADGSTWGYTSVPAAGVEWWRQLPTRKASGDSPA
jgi:hypothetical protein